jgi:hypothetical protein
LPNLLIPLPFCCGLYPHDVQGLWCFDLRWEASSIADIESRNWQSGNGSRHESSLSTGTGERRDPALPSRRVRGIRRCYVIHIPVFFVPRSGPEIGITMIEMDPDFPAFRATTGFAQRSASCCTIMHRFDVREILCLYINWLQECRGSHARDICATIARKQPQLAQNQAVFCCVIGGLLSLMELRRRGASRGRPVRWFA